MTNNFQPKRIFRWIRDPEFHIGRTLLLSMCNMEEIYDHILPKCKKWQLNHCV